MLKVLSVMILVFPMALFAGGSDGGGGNGVVCYNPASPKEIVSVELLDFYEGKVLEGYEINERDGSYLDILEHVIEKSASQEVKDYLKSYTNFNRGFKFLPPGVRLKPINDSSEIFIPDNCKVEQIINFQGPSRIFVVGDFWNLLSETHKAGLLLHEILWKTEREAGVKNSARARRSVARFFADNYQFEKLAISGKKGDFLCRSSGEVSLGSPVGFYGHTSFLLKRTKEKDLCKLHFITLNNAMVFSSEVAELDGCEDFLWFDANLNIGFLKPVEVRSVTENLITHIVTLGKRIEINGRVKKQSTSVEVENLEFPNYQSNETDLYCNEIKE